jgi:hypothetical protein
MTVRRRTNHAGAVAIDSTKEQWAAKLSTYRSLASSTSKPVPVRIALRSSDAATRLAPFASWGGRKSTHPSVVAASQIHPASIEAHLNIVFTALAVSHWIENQTGWSIKKFVRTARRYRTVTIRAGQQTLTAADPIPDHLREALATINPPDSAH